MIQLNAEQEYIVQQAVEWYNHSNEQLFQYDGPPGSGKSVVLYEIVNRLGLDINTEVAPMTFIGAASLVMRNKGLYNAKTAHSWLYDLVEIPKRDETGSIVYKSNGKPVTTLGFMPKETIGTNIKLIVVDEAFCMPRSLRPIIESYGIKIIACGDANQLPPVADHPAFLIDGTIYHLRTIVRQTDRDDILFIANRVTNGLPVFNGYYGNSMVIDREDVTDEMLLWADVIICGTNRTRDILNKHIRSLKGYNSLLPMYGEKLVCRNNNWSLESSDSFGRKINLVNGLIGTVLNEPSIDSYDPKYRTFDLRFLCDDAQCVFKCKASYDYIISSHTNRQLIKNDNNLYMNGQLFEFAYCITCHISQGSQFNKVLYIEEFVDHNIQPRLNLVGATRAVKQLIYVNNDNKPWRSYPDDYDPNISLTYYNSRINNIRDRYKKLQEIKQYRSTGMTVFNKKKVINKTKRVK